MGKKIMKAISAVLLIAMLSGCGEGAPAQMEGGLIQSQTAGKGGAQGDTAQGGTMQKDTAQGGTMQGDTAKGNAAQDGGAQGNAAQGGTVQGGGAQGSAAQKGGTDPAAGSVPEMYHMDEVYTQEENILPLTESASAGGITYKIEKAEYTESFGGRDKSRLNIYAPGAVTDNQGNLSGDFKYLFLTITFTNTTDRTQEIYRTSNSISVIGATLNTISWTTDACYYDVDWEKGTESQKHHWLLEPGESVTSEVGWVIEGCDSMLAADDALETRMGSGGPYELYYHVEQYTGSNEGSYFIDLGVKVE